MILTKHKENERSPQQTADVERVFKEELQKQYVENPKSTFFANFIKPLFVSSVVFFVLSILLKNLYLFFLSIIAFGLVGVSARLDTDVNQINSFNSFHRAADKTAERTGDEKLLELKKKQNINGMILLFLFFIACVIVGLILHYLQLFLLYLKNS